MKSGISVTGAVRVFPNRSPVADPDRRDMPLPFDRGFELIGERQQQGLPAPAGSPLSLKPISLPIAGVPAKLSIQQ